MNSTTIKGYAAGLSAILIWSSTYIATTRLLRTFTPMEIAVVRFLIGAAALIILAPPKRLPGSFRSELPFLASGLTGFFLYSFFENTAIRFTTVSHISIIVTTIPLLTSLLAPLFFKERFSNRYIAAFLLSMSGILLIILTGAAETGSGSVKGDLLALGAVVSFTAYTLIQRTITKDTDPLTSVRKSLVYGGLAALVYGYFTGNLPAPSRAASLPGLWYFLYLGIAASGLAFAAWSRSIVLLGSVKTSQLIYLMPFFSIFFARIFLEEPVTLAKLISLGLTLGGVVYAQRAPAIQKTDLKT